MAPLGRVALCELGTTTHHQVAATAGHASLTGAPAPGSPCASWRALVTTHHQVAATTRRASSTGAPAPGSPLRAMVTTHHVVAATTRRASSTGAPAPGSPLRAMVTAHHVLAATTRRASSTGAPAPGSPCASVRRRGHHASPGCGDRGPRVWASVARAWVALHELARASHHASPGCDDRKAALLRPAPLGQGPSRAGPCARGRASSPGAPWARVALRELVTTITKLRRPQAALLRPAHLGLGRPARACADLVTTHHQGCGDRGPRVWARVALYELVTTHHQVAATAGRASSTGTPGPGCPCASRCELVTTHHQVAATEGRASFDRRPWARVDLRELARD